MALIDSRILMISFLILNAYGFLVFVILYRERQRKLYLQCITKMKRVQQKRSRAKNLRQIRKKRRSYWAQDRCTSWWKKMLDGVHPEEEWKKNFRMDRADVMKLVNRFENVLSPDPTSPNWKSVDAINWVACILYYLKDKGSLLMTVNQLGVATAK